MAAFFSQIQTPGRAKQVYQAGIQDNPKLTLAVLRGADMLEGSTSVWTWDDGLYHLPHCWGSEAISWRTDLWKGDPATLSYGSLWEDGVKGHVQGRPHSLLLGIGLWMDGNGTLPSNRMLDATVALMNAK